MKEEEFQKKYSKISPALKSYFLHSLYYKCMTIKDAAARCKLNYSTAKVIIRDLSHRERKYVKRIIRIKESNMQKGKFQTLNTCFYREIFQKENSFKSESESQRTQAIKQFKKIEVVSRVGFDFFSKCQKDE